MSKMIELHDIDVPGFLSVLDSCEGNVYLMTRDGDKPVSYTHLTLPTTSRV